MITEYALLMVVVSLIAATTAKVLARQIEHMPLTSNVSTFCGKPCTEFHTTAGSWPSQRGSR